MSKRDIIQAQRIVRRMKEQDEAVLVRSLRANGYTLEKIAGIIGRSTSWVWKVVNQQTAAVRCDVSDRMPDSSSQQDDDNIMKILEMEE